MISLIINYIQILLIVHYYRRMQNKQFRPWDHKVGLNVMTFRTCLAERFWTTYVWIGSRNLAMSSTCSSGCTIGWSVAVGLSWCDGCDGSNLFSSRGITRSEHSTVAITAFRLWEVVDGWSEREFTTRVFIRAADCRALFWSKRSKCSRCVGLNPMYSKIERFFFFFAFHSKFEQLYTKNYEFKFFETANIALHIFFKMLEDVAYIFPG